MPVYYNSKKIIPAPFISINKQYQTTDDGKIVGSVFEINVKGKFVAYMGSPNSSQTFWDIGGYPPDESPTDSEMMKNIVRKQEALRSLFATEGASFEIQPWNGSAPIKCNPRVKSIVFPMGSPISWYNIADYEINLEADVLYVNGTSAGEDGGVNAYKISKASEDWNIEPVDDKKVSFRLTHSLSAVGKRFYDDTGALAQEAWENAKDYVLNSLGLGLDVAMMQAEDVLDATSLSAYNYVRTQSVNKLNGTFQVTETWLCYNANGEAPAIEEYTVDVRTDETEKTRVTINGQVQGLEQRDNTTYALVTSRYTNALSKWTTNVLPNLLSRAENLSGIDLFSTSLSNQVGHNQINGVISYTYEYDDRDDSLISGAKSENITIINNHPSDVFASIPVLGRALGPVLQDIATVTARKRVIQIEAQMRAKTRSYTPTQPNTDSIVTDNTPTSYSVLFMDEDNESWNEYTGRYTRTTSFTWEL